MNIRKKLVICSALGIVLTIAFLMWYYSPGKVFQRKLNLQLPKSSEIINCQYSFFNDQLAMKVAINGEEYEKIENELNNHFKTNNFFTLVQDRPEGLPNFGNIHSWWDMDLDNMVLAFQSFTKGKRTMTAGIYVFVTKGEEGQYFLYVDM